MKKIYLVGGKWSTIGDKLIYNIQERELCRRGFALTCNMKDADIVVIGGGGTLYSRLGRMTQEYNGQALDYPLTDLLEARDRGAKIIVAGAGYQGFDGEANRDAWRQVLLAASSISVRDVASAHAVSELIGNSKPIEVWPDMAFGLQVEETEPMLKRTIAVSIGQEGLTEERREAIEKLLPYLAASYSLVWIPFDQAELVAYHSHYIPKFGGTLLSDEVFATHYMIPNVSMAIGAFQSCSGIFSTRLHALLLAIMVGRPILHAGKINPKVAAQVKDLFGVADYPGMVSMQEPTKELVNRAHIIFNSLPVKEIFKDIYQKSKPLSVKHFNVFDTLGA